ncbi:MAG: PD40 domain-containing protein [Saprospiraceae bacterium]|nr:PD40 domain-containing protein [Candidatus Vicinibacter affinis]MBK6822197.1 PD40 domain-containing protein [Candidatus Vicinibacter affinis]MBK7302015.1 PD40 domain-containing protein [Candidatus Vicinibacter affinis]MBK7797961.1 PD40 domain-containing protein [Candidatus Vicinibacter affinis]MBK9642472.1 PD40 domain-containing protein [Candidatus Vicinibacter affinis]
MKIPLTLFIILICSWTYAQDYISLKSASEKQLKSYKKAMVAYRSNKFDDAIKLLNKIIKTEPKFIDAHIILGSVYYDKKEFSSAEKSFNEAINIDPTYQVKVFYTLALCNYELEHYADAKNNMGKFLDKETQNQELIAKAKRRYTTFRFTDSAVAHPLKYQPQNFRIMNSDFSEYLPSLTADGNTMVFTRKIYRENEDLFISTRVEGSGWSSPESLDEINTVFNEGAPAISPDGNTLVFTSCDRKESFGGCDLFISKKENGKWGPAVNLGDKINTPAYESQPCFGDNGNLIFFCSNRTGSIGGKDIWFSYRLEDRSWAKPLNLGSNVNTIENEECPFLHPNGLTLFFSSDGHPGLGAKDVFYSEKTGANKWSTAVNLGYPLNSKGDESSFILNYRGDTGYIASDKEFNVMDQKNKNIQKNLDLFEFVMPEALRPNPSSYLYITVVDRKTNAPVQAQLKVFKLGQNEKFYTGKTNQEGKSLISLPSNEIYAIDLYHPEYMIHSEQYNCIETRTAYRPLRLTISLDKIKDAIGSIVLKNIFFESGSAVLKSESDFELNQIFELLKNKNITKVLISGHTDNVGKKEDNLLLSQNRAKAVVQALIEKGIDPRRLVSEGKGESQPIADNNTEVGRQNNRRTEIKIIPE